MKIDKNSFSAKFRYFYLYNLKGIKEALEEIRWAFDEILPELIKIILNVLTVALRIFSCFIPYRQIINTFRSQYLSEKEAMELGYFRGDGYFSKREIKKERAILENYEKDKRLSTGKRHE